jgi:hypothetical protein
MEYRFYRRYNDLNKKREYAVYCYNEASTGSRFKTPYCQPVWEHLNGRSLARDKIVPGDKDALPDTPAPTEDPDDARCY